MVWTQSFPLIRHPLLTGRASCLAAAMLGSLAHGCFKGYLQLTYTHAHTPIYTPIYSADAFYMNFTICSIDVYLNSISCDVYSLKSVYDSLFNDKTLFKLNVYSFIFVFCNCSHAILSSLFCCSHARGLGDRSCMSSFPVAELGGASGSCLGSAFSKTVLVIDCE